MPNEGQKQNNPNFLTKAAVGVAIGAIAAVGGYFFGKVVAEEEAAKMENPHQQPRANTSSHANHSQQHTHQARQHVTDEDELKKRALGYHDARECGICFRDFEEVKRNDEAIHTTPCGHVYCFECLQESLSRNPVCPSCRFTVLPNQTMRVYL